jgi:hypothetical protein
VWDPAAGKELRRLQGHGRPVQAVAFSPDGTQLASASQDSTVKLWDPAAGKELHTLKGHARWVLGVAFSPDGARLASASSDGTVKVWDTTTGRELRTLRGHMALVLSVAFTPDGRRLASGSRAGAVKVWDTASWQELRALQGHTGDVLSVAFSPDGHRLASARDDGTLKLWDARPLTAEVKAEVEAVALLHWLFARPLPRSAARAAIQRDEAIGEVVRQKALEFVERFQEETDSKRYHDAAWPLVRHPYANVFMRRLALAQMSVACARAPDQAAYRLGLAVTQYRLGKFEKEHYAKALATLTRCPQDNPTTLAFLAMTQYQLGQKEQARTTLARLRAVMTKPTWTANVEAGAFLREAVTLIEGKT